MKKEKLPHEGIWPRAWATIVRVDPETKEMEMYFDSDRGSLRPVVHHVKGVGMIGTLNLVDADGRQAAPPLAGTFVETRDGIYFFGTVATRPWRIEDIFEEDNDFGPIIFSAEARFDDQADVVINGVWLDLG